MQLRRHNFCWFNSKATEALFSIPFLLCELFLEQERRSERNYKLIPGHHPCRPFSQSSVVLCKLKGLVLGFEIIKVHYSRMIKCTDQRYGIWKKLLSHEMYFTKCLRSVFSRNTNSGKHRFAQNLSTF